LDGKSANTILIRSKLRPNIILAREQKTQIL